MASNAGSVYDLLRWIMQQQNLQQPDYGSAQSATPSPSSDGYGSPQGGLFGRLLAQNPEQPQAENNGSILSEPRDPNFRQLSRRLAQPKETIAPSNTPGGIYANLAPTFNVDDVEAAAEGASAPKSGDQQYAMGRRPTHSQCVDRCMHLLLFPPSGDLQSSEFRQCVGQCMGRL